ncbi:hypothetical protein ACFE04_014278 [Oxalis oulophora]
MAWNVFKFCTALRALGSIMILFVLGIVGVTYYCVVIAIYAPALFNNNNTSWTDSFTSLLVLLIFHSLLVMLLWSYFAVVLTDPGGVPPGWKPEVDEESNNEHVIMGIDQTQLSMLGNPVIEGVRFCRKCNQFKPPRCHHCSICGRCILKMDHHCVWVVNCVGALNYKYFLLFLFYTFVEATVATLSLLRVFIGFFTDGEIPESPGTLVAIFITFVLNFAFALSVMGFLIMHITFVVSNTTTIEAFEKKTSPKWRYDLGRRKNFEQLSYISLLMAYGLWLMAYGLWHDVDVFGTSKKYWFLPTYAEQDQKHMSVLQGFDCPIRQDLNLVQQL